MSSVPLTLNQRVTGSIPVAPTKNCKKSKYLRERRESASSRKCERWVKRWANLENRRTLRRQAATAYLPGSGLDVQPKTIMSVTAVAVGRRAVVSPAKFVNDYKWELYNLTENYSENNDLAGKIPDKLPDASLEDVAHP